MRQIKTSNEFFDILDRIGNGKFVTIGYVTGANLNVPTIKKRNPLTNRMKGYPDYSVFKSDEDGEIGALVKITSYNMQYLNRQTVGRKYGEYKDSANKIRGSFGIDPIGDKAGYKKGTDWSPNGPELYNGSNEDLQSHSYNPQNLFGAKIKGTVYAVDTEGHIIKELPAEQIKPYLKAKREVDGVAALRKMGVEEEKIQDYISQIQNLKFSYKNFESNSILWIAATIDGEKIVYINDNLSRAVDGINIRPEDFRSIARERYQIDLANLQESSAGRTLRLTEGELRKVISESVRNVLSELDWKTYASARDKARYQADNPNMGRFDRTRRDNQARAFADMTHDVCDKQYGIDKIRQKEKEWKLNNKFQDYPHSNGDLKRFQRQADDIEDYIGNNVHYVSGKGWERGPRESMAAVRTIRESFQNNQHYSHFAVSKKTGKIVNGWDYWEEDPSDLRQWKKDYFDTDMIDYGFNPKDFRILTYKYLVKNGQNPDDNANWANNDEANSDWTGQ